MSREEIGGRIFIGGLDHNCDEEVLEKSFNMFGEVVQVMVMKDRETNRSRGFAFLSFKDQSSADEAIRRMHGVEIQGRCVTVRKAEKQASFGDRPRRGGYRGGGRGDSRSFSGRSDRYDESYGRGRPSRGFDDYRAGGRDSGYNDTRRSSYGDSRGVYKADDRDSRRGGYSHSGGYSDSRMASDTRSTGYDYRRADSGADSYRYSDRRDDATARYSTEILSRDPYGGRYESHARSRSPVARVPYREESPVRSRRMDARRDYSPPVIQRGEHGVREYSPVISRRVDASRDLDYQDRREFVDTSYSPPTSRRVRDPSPDEFTSRYAGANSGDLGSPPRGRSTYTASRATYDKSPVHKSEYLPRKDVGRTRDSGYADNGMSKDYHHSSRGYAADRGSGGRSSTGLMENNGNRYSSNRYRGASPPTVAEVGRSSSKRSAPRSRSPDQRNRRY